MKEEKRDKKLARTQNMASVGIALMVLSDQATPVNNTAWTIFRSLLLVAGIAAFLWAQIKFSRI